MKPPKTEKTDYEKVDVNDFVTGVIDEIQYDMEHKFKGFEGNPDKVKPAIRFKFKIDGYSHPHYSRWMSFIYSEKSNLLIKYLMPLVEGAQPDMDFDMEALRGMKVKMLWSEKNGFQSVETIRPIGKKLAFQNVELPSIQIDEIEQDENLPF